MPTVSAIALFGLVVQTNSNELAACHAVDGQYKVFDWALKTSRLRLSCLSASFFGERACSPYPRAPAWGRAPLHALYLYADSTTFPKAHHLLSMLLIKLVLLVIKQSRGVSSISCSSRCC